MYYVVYGFKMVDNESVVTMPDKRELNMSGQYVAETADEDILNAIRKSAFPAVTARWVADTLGIERPSAHRRLEDVVYRDGRLSTPLPERG